jgi:ribonuclease R
MLPKEISNGLCSLHPWEDKLTLTCEMHINSAWVVTKRDVYNSVIISDYRLTYKEIDEFVSWEIKPWDDLLFGEKISEYLFENIKNLKILTDILSKNTENRGSLDFDFPETKIILDDVWYPVEYKKSVRYDSYKIIEECMVLANESVSKEFSKYPFLYRIHEDPDGEDVEKFTKMLETIVPVADIPWDFPAILSLLQSDPGLQYLQKLLLRSLSKARYSEKNMWHFGLALKFYSHFTSPIRRYPDLQIHRIIKEVVKWKFGWERRDYYNEILPKVARRSSDTADRSEKMEYKVRDMLACKYMADKIWKEFKANISGMIEKWFFVELPDTIEGFVDYGMTGLSYNPEHMWLESADGTKKLHFGGEINVKLIDIDTQRMRLEFELV